MESWKKLFVAIILGLIVGLVLREYSYTNSKGEEILYVSYLKPIGSVFMNLIKMLVVPLIFASFTSAIISMKDINAMGRLGGKSFVMYIITTAFASVSGLFFAVLSNVGGGIKSDNLAMNLDKGNKIEAASQNLGIIDTVVNIIPTNPAFALANGNALQIIVFTVFFGIAINITGKKAQKLADVIDSLAETMYSLTNIVMRFAPYGVFALMAVLVGTQNIHILTAVIKLIIVGYGIYIIHVVVVYGTMIKIIGRLSFWRFIKKIFPVQLVAYTTSSSAATLPVTMNVLQNKVGVSKTTSDFVLPLGTTINMDGTSMTIGLYTVFLAGVYGIDLTFANYIYIALSSCIISIGAAGIPSASLVMLSIILTSVGVPLEGVAIVVAFDRILDMARTVVNVTGDASVSVLVDKTEGKFDQKKFNQSN